jgi:hypothetical protein
MNNLRTNTQYSWPIFLLCTLCRYITRLELLACVHILGFLSQYLVSRCIAIKVVAVSRFVWKFHFIMYIYVCMQAYIYIYIYKAFCVLHQRWYVKLRFYMRPVRLTFIAVLHNIYNQCLAHVHTCMHVLSMYACVVYPHACIRCTCAYVVHLTRMHASTFRN